jgi:alcohol dehydrogenase YqhD (iron-dependent ADH family)
MKFSRTDCTVWTIPGTGMEIMEFTVIKEKSSRQFQMCCTNTENPKLIAKCSLI